MSEFAVMQRGAEFSEDRSHRYSLWRRWGDGPVCNVIGLNPSVADENEDDPTIRRCVRYARDWKLDGLVMTNLYAYCSTAPKRLPYSAVVAIGGQYGDAVLVREAAAAGIVVAAWGALPKAHEWRIGQVRRMLREAGVTLHAIRTTKGGEPAHPLYLPASLTPVVWQGVPSRIAPGPQPGGKGVFSCR